MIDSAFFATPEIEDKFRKWVTQTTLAQEEQGGILLCDHIYRRGRPGRNLPYREGMKAVGSSQALVIQGIFPAVNTAKDRVHAFNPGDWARLLDIGWSLHVLHDGYKPILYHTHPGADGKPSPADWKWAADMSKAPHHVETFAVVGVQPFDVRFYDLSVRSPKGEGTGAWSRVEFLSHHGWRYRDTAFETAYREAINRMELAAAGVAV